MALLNSIPWSVTLSDGSKTLGLMPGLREYCAQCGQQFETLGIYVPSKDKAFQIFDKCELHRVGYVREPHKPEPIPFGTLEARWKKLCPELYQGVELDTLPSALRTVVSRYEYNPKGLFLIGETGTHKSRASHLVMERLYYSGKTVKMFHPGEFPEQWLASYRGEANDLGYHKIWMENIVWTQAVLFDDFGQDALSDKCATAFFTIIDRRLAMKRPTFFNTNFSSARLLQKLPAENAMQMLRRICDACEVVQTGKATFHPTF